MRCNKDKLTLTWFKCSKISLVTSKFLGNFRACRNSAGNGHFSISLDLAIPLPSFFSWDLIRFLISFRSILSNFLTTSQNGNRLDFIKLVCVDNLCTLIIRIRLSLGRKLPFFSPTQCLYESSYLALGLFHLFINSCKHGLKPLILLTLFLYESVKHIFQRWSRWWWSSMWGVKIPWTSGIQHIVTLITQIWMISHIWIIIVRIWRII